MATTPLARLLHDVIHEPETRAQFAAAPESFLADHGYRRVHNPEALN